MDWHRSGAPQSCAHLLGQSADRSSPLAAENCSPFAHAFQQFFKHSGFHP